MDEWRNDVARERTGWACEEDGICGITPVLDQWASVSSCIAGSFVIEVSVIYGAVLRMFVSESIQITDDIW